MQMNPKEKKYNYSEVFSEGLQDIILASDLGRNIGLISSFYPREIRQQTEKGKAIYNRLKNFIEENVLNYQYRQILLNKITFLFKYGEINYLKDNDNVLEVIGSVIGNIKKSSVYTLGININSEKIVVTSMDGTEDESISTIIEVIYKTIPQDNMSSYIKDISIRTKNYIDVDTPYEDRNITEKFLALKKENGNVITTLKRRNTKETTTILCNRYQGFKENRIIREKKKNVTEWNGTGINSGYVIGAYNSCTNEYGKRIDGEEYFYAARNNSPTLCDITTDSVKIQLSPAEFNIAISGDNLVKIIPIFYKINEAENEYTFGTLKKIESTKRFL